MSSFFFDDELRPEIVAAIDRNTAQLKRSADASESIAALFHKIANKVFRPKPPRALNGGAVIEENDMFKVRVPLPDWSLASPDVQFGTVYCNIAGVETTHRVEKTDVEFVSPEGNEADECVLQMTYTDDALPTGLESAKSPEAKYLFADTQPPAAPAALGGGVVEEV